MKIHLIYLVLLSFSPIIFSSFVFAEPSLTITDCIQSHHYIKFETHATGFLPNTKILVFYYLPDSDKGAGASSHTDPSGAWDRQWGHLSSDDIPYGKWKLEAYHVDDNLNRLPGSPYASTEFETPCPFPTDPPDTEVYATINGKRISSGDSVTSNSINFGYSIRDSFSSFAKFDCKLDEGQYEDCTTIRCEDSNSCSLNHRGTVMDGYSEKDYDNLSVGKHIFMVKATDDSDNVDPTPAEFTWTILGPIADAGQDQSVKSNELVQLDGSSSSDPDDSVLNYSWNQTAGPEVVLNDVDSVNPTFTAPNVNEQTYLIFQLIVINQEGTTSEPDHVTVTVSPISIPPPEEGTPRTIGDLIKGILENPLDLTNSIESANDIRDILTDNDRGNDQLVCDLLDSEDQFSSGIREILDC